MLEHYHTRAGRLAGYRTRSGTVGGTRGRVVRGATWIEDFIIVVVFLKPVLRLLSEARSVHGSSILAETANCIANKFDNLKNLRI